MGKDPGLMKTSTAGSGSFPSDQLSTGAPCHMCGPHNMPPPRGGVCWLLLLSTLSPRASHTHAPETGPSWGAGC